MTFEELFVHKLTEIVEFNNNVFPLIVDEGIEAPYISYNQTGGNYIKDLSGQSDLMSYSYQLNILAAKYDILKNLEQKVITKTRELQGRIVEKMVQEIIIEAPSEVYEEETNLRRATIEFTVYF